MDYRLEENRKEAFIRWYAWSLKYDDCDPAVWATNYLNTRYEHNAGCMVIHTIFQLHGFS